MVGERLIDLEKQLRRCRISHVGVRRNLVALYVSIAVSVRVIDVEESVARVIRMEGNAQQSLLTTALHAVGDIDERGRKRGAVLYDSNPPSLLDDKEPRIIRR